MADPQPSLLDSPEALEARRIWGRALPQLANKLTRMTFESFVAQIRPIALVDRRIELGVATAFAKEWLERRYEGAIRSVLEAVAGRNLEVVFRVMPKTFATGEPEAHTTDGVQSNEIHNHRTANRQDTKLGEYHREICAPFDTRLTFETFVVGKTNRLAYSAAMAVADTPGLHFNPLFIYGPSGLGKTHLLHSIGQRIAAANGSLRILLVDGESFTHHYVNSLREKRFDLFRRYLRSVDVWLVDDIQSIAGKEHTREEFFHTLNAMQQRRKQIVLTSDKTPRELHAMDDRLRSRLEAGLIADIAPPELETRLAILQQFCLQNGYDIPEDVCYVIADSIQSNIRALEGAATRVAIQSSVLQVPPDLELVESVLTHFFIDMRGARLKRAVSLTTVASVVGESFGVSVEALVSKRRDTRTSLARHVFMYLARDLCHESCKAIGAYLGGRSHTTIQRGAEHVLSLMDRDPDLRRHVLALQAKIRAH